MNLRHWRSEVWPKLGRKTAECQSPKSPQNSKRFRLNLQMKGLLSHLIQPSRTRTLLIAMIRGRVISQQGHLIILTYLVTQTNPMMKSPKGTPRAVTRVQVTLPSHFFVNSSRLRVVMHHEQRLGQRPIKGFHLRFFFKKNVAIFWLEPCLLLRRLLINLSYAGGCAICLDRSGLKVFCFVWMCMWQIRLLAKYFWKLLESALAAQCPRHEAFLLPWQLELATACRSKSMRKLSGPTRCQSWKLTCPWLWMVWHASMLAYWKIYWTRQREMKAMTHKPPSILLEELRRQFQQRQISQWHQGRKQALASRVWWMPWRRSPDSMPPEKSFDKESSQPRAVPTLPTS